MEISNETYVKWRSWFRLGENFSVSALASGASRGQQVETVIEIISQRTEFSSMSHLQRDRM